jgi:chromosome segregation ATPase
MRRIKQQLSEPALMLDKTLTEVQELEQKYNTLESETAGLRQEREQLQGELVSSQTAQQRAQSQIAELTAKLQQTSRDLADLDKERTANKLSQQKAEDLYLQVERFRIAAEQAELHARDSAAQSTGWEKKAADLKKAVDELNQTRVHEQTASTQSAQRLKELELQLKGANDTLTASRAETEKQNSARQRLESENQNLAQANAKAKADLDKERTAGKLSQQKAEELNLQVEKLRNAVDHAELRVRESATQSKDWEKKAADLKKAVDELNQIRVSEQSAGAQSAQRLKELDQQLKGANDNLAASRADLDKQHSARQRLESESRSLTEANAKAKVEADKERTANNALRQETEKLTAQLKKLQQSAEESELRARESAAQSKDWEKKAADLKKAADELNQIRVSEQSANAQSLKHLKEVELQLKGANDNLTASRAETEKQNSARQQLEAENRKLAEANAKARADLEKERDANKLSRQEAQELNSELEKAQRAAEQAEARFQKGAALGSEWQEKAAELKKANSQLNAELVRLREIEKNAQHEEYMMVDSLRRGLRQQIEELRHSASGLLEIQLPDKQKRLAETILRNALFLQVFLNASGKNAGEKFPS